MIIYGNELAASFKQKMKAEIEILKKENKRLPLLAVILVGNNRQASLMCGPRKACLSIGWRTRRLCCQKIFHSRN